MSSIKLSESGFADDGDTEIEYKKAMLHKTHIEIEDVVDGEAPVRSAKIHKHSKHGDGKHQDVIRKQTEQNYTFSLPIED